MNEVHSPECCGDCPLPRARRLGARGDRQSPFVIVTEGPGNEDLKYNALFSGSVSEVIERVLPTWLKLEDIYVITAMQCRVKHGKPATELSLKSQAVNACNKRLLDQIFEYPRKSILALGSWSNVSLSGNANFKITQKRGEPYNLISPRQRQPIVVVPAVHPAFLMRNVSAGLFRIFQDDVTMSLSYCYDIKSARRKSKWYEPTFEILDTWKAISDYHEWLVDNNHTHVACDIETSGFSSHKDDIIDFGFCDVDTQRICIIPRNLVQQQDIATAVRRLLEDSRLNFIFQFGKFDTGFFRAKKLLGTHVANRLDIGLMSYALSETSKSHDLDELGKNYLNAPVHKDALKKWTGGKKKVSYADIPVAVLQDYLAKDLLKTALVYTEIYPLICAEPKLLSLHNDILIPTANMLSNVELRGIQTDPHFVRLNRAAFECELEEIQQKLLAELGYVLNPNSSAQVKKVLYQELKLTIKGKTPSSTSKGILAKLPQHPVLLLIQEYRSVVKRLNTYVKAIETKNINDRVHTSYKQHITTTGRLSSSDPNIQNIPRNSILRRMYCAKPGYKLLEMDYNTAELRMLAAVSKDEFLTEVFLDDKRNLHDEVSISMYGPNFTGDQRIRAKAINFGIPYGREAYSIAIEYDISVEEAQRLIDAWFARAPQAAAYIKSCRRAPIDRRYLETVFGRRRRPGIVTAENLKGLQNEFANFGMQSPISDFTVLSGVRLDPILQSQYDTGIVNLIHDSLLLEVPDDEKIIREVFHITRETMETLPHEWIDTPVPFKVDGKIGTHWGLCKNYLG